MFPFILGSLGTVTKQLKHHRAVMSLDSVLGGLQTSVLVEHTDETHENGHQKETKKGKQTQRR